MVKFLLRIASLRDFLHFLVTSYFPFGPDLLPRILSSDASYLLVLLFDHEDGGIIFL
jgi:hypothetical protein